MARGKFPRTERKSSLVLGNSPRGLEAFPNVEVVDLRECDQYLFTLRQIVLLIIPAMLSQARTLLLHRGVTDGNY